MGRGAVTKEFGMMDMCATCMMAICIFPTPTTSMSTAYQSALNSQTNAIAERAAQDTQPVMSMARAVVMKLSRMVTMSIIWLAIGFTISTVTIATIMVMLRLQLDL